jgi:hypothetical protein
MTTVADYIDRTCDVSAFQNWEDALGKEVLLEQSLGDTETPGGEVITGVAKLCQRFLMILLTEQGSLKYLPTAGCRFMTDALRGRWRTSADVQQSFYFSLLDVRRQMRQMELSTDPDDERLAGVTILGIVLSPRDRAVLRLSLTTQAGTKRAFLAPISVVPR